MAMDSKDIRATRRIKDWAEREVTLHKRECKDAPNCAGRAAVWWVTRHPDVHPEIANQTAIDYVVSRQPCEILEARLVTGSAAASGVALRWLPGERKLNRSRTTEEKDQLLGRTYFLGEAPGSQEVLSGLSREVVTERATELRNKPSAPFYEPEVPATTDWVDALTRRDR